MADGPVVHRVADARLPTERGPFRCLAFQSDADDVTSSRWCAVLSAGPTSRCSYGSTASA